MKFILGMLPPLVSISAAFAQYLQRNNYGLGGNGLSGTGSNSNSHYSSGYTTQSGTTVQPHYQTNSNNTQLDNYSTRGNVNPYTGAVGTRSPHY